MVLANSEFVQFIRDEVLVNGPVSFQWFMEQALYHPEFGYYRADKVRIGVHGDYYTSVSVGPLYGAILACLFREMHRAVASPDKFTIVEAGAEDGQLAADILAELRNGGGDLPATVVDYLIIEPFPEKKARQQDLLAGFGAQVKWVEDLASVPVCTGVILASELLDAFPVHLVEFSGSDWRELCVNCSDVGLNLEPLPINNPALAEHLQKLPIPSSTPYRTEVNLAAHEWTAAAVKRLKRGFLLVVDYGYRRDEYYSPLRYQGTLTCYQGHRRSFDPLESPGQMDLTAHVDFTSIVEAAAGFEIVGFADQHHFMVGAGEKRLRELEHGGQLNQKEKRFLRQYKTLMLPGNLGMTFKFLLLGSPGLRQAELSGFRHSQKEVG
jgi:SAM-dependent MidA family methyltransferase